MTRWPNTCSGFSERHSEPQGVTGSQKLEPSAGRRALYTFAVTMMAGGGIAVALQPIGLGFLSGFASGATYMLAAAVIINSRSTASNRPEHPG